MLNCPELPCSAPIGLPLELLILSCSRDNPRGDENRLSMEWADFKLHPFLIETQHALASPPMSFNSNDRPHRSLLSRLCSSAIYDKTFCREITANYIPHPVPALEDCGGLHQDFTRICAVASDFTVDDRPIEISKISRLQMTRLSSDLLGTISIGLATIPGLVLASISIRFHSAPTNCSCLIFAIALTLTGLQLFCFGLSAASLLEQYHNLMEQELP